MAVSDKSFLNNRYDTVDDSDAFKQLWLVNSEFEPLRGLTEAFGVKRLFVMRSPTQNDAFDFIGLERAIVVKSFFRVNSNLEMVNERFDFGSWQLIVIGIDWSDRIGGLNEEAENVPEN